jgi:outer membrane protein assembly factor BamC
MKNIIKLFFLGIAVALAGCSYVQSLFPDKEKDYQYTTEIPLLTWPAELRGNSAATTPTIGNSSPDVSSSDADLETDDSVGKVDSGSSTATDNSSNPSTEGTTATATSETTVTPAGENEESDSVSSVEIIKYDDGESRLRIGSRFPKAWRVVSKALSRNTIEVTERNNDQGQMIVLYDPDEKKAKDDSYWDELSFLFHGINAHEQKYFLKLEEHDQLTDVIVTNEEHLPLVNDAAALRLLKLLADTIKTEQGTKK